ncbi:MAG: proton-conducting transporter membrane subunit [Thermoplasmata archaeon]
MVWGTLVDSTPGLIVITPLFLAFLITLLERLFGRSNQILFLTGLALTSFFVGLMAFEVLTVGGWSYVFGAEQPSPENGKSFFRIIFLADGFSVLSTITIVLIAFTTGLYSIGYMKNKPDLSRFYSLFFLTFAGLNGMVLTNDLFNMFVWFEVTSIASSGLIAFENYRGKSVEAALKYLFVSVIGGLFFLFSIALFYGQYGVLNLQLLSEAMTGSYNDEMAVGLITVVFAMKSSSVPFHFWTPEVHGDAPGPVSPFIAIMVMGYLLALFRLLTSVFTGSISSEIIGLIIILLGAFSMVVGVFIAFSTDDIKLVVVYLSISQIGYIMLVVGVGLTTLNTTRYQEFGQLSFASGLFHVINDAVYKTLLFLSVITMGRVAGTRDKRQLSGMLHRLPYTTVFFIIAGLSISGFPPFSGFYSKFLIYRATYSFHPILGLFTVVMTALIFLLMAQLFSSVFLGPVDEEPEGSVSRSMLASMVILTIIVIVFSIIPHIFVSEVVIPAVEALTTSF